MSEKLHRQRLETEAIVIGYAMSRLDTDYLVGRNLASWRQCFDEASRSMGKPPTTFKNLRDEFDPVHGNARQGWRHRALRPNRQRVLDELSDLSKDALMELVARILQRDSGVVQEAIDSMAVQTRIAHNVAQRLLTGRDAEEYFMTHSMRLAQVERADLIDMRIRAQGFDFGVLRRPEIAIEVKGLRAERGEIQFTDREWLEAKDRADNYWLIVVGKLASTPRAAVIRNPHSLLDAKCRYQTSITAAWHSRVSV